MKLASEILVKILQFIKYDVKRYEHFVSPLLDHRINKFHPLLQIELLGEKNRKYVVDYLESKGYYIFKLKYTSPRPIQKNDIFSMNQDFYFIYEAKLEHNAHLIRNT
ncbi:MAG: hypothetical protein R2780_11610 [Crocinitomicaceae bacterium]